MTATVGGGPSFVLQIGDTESKDRWELEDEQDKRKGTKQVAVKKAIRVLVK
jgi:hypothetical protein